MKYVTVAKVCPEKQNTLTDTPFQNNLEEFGNILCCYEVLCVMVIRGRLKTGGFMIYLELNNITYIRVSEVRTKLALSVGIHNGDLQKSPLWICTKGSNFVLISLTLTYATLFSSKDV